MNPVVKLTMACKHFDGYNEAGVNRSPYCLLCSFDRNRN